MSQPKSHKRDSIPNFIVKPHQAFNGYILNCNLFSSTPAQEGMHILLVDNARISISANKPTRGHAIMLFNSIPSLVSYDNASRIIHQLF